MNISLETLKAIVAKADEELGGNNGTVTFNENSNSWGTKEKYYKSSLSIHSLAIQTGEYYEYKEKHSQFVKPEGETRW